MATFLPEGGGYAGLLHGKVVDMFYMPIWGGFYPDWIPFFGGKPFLFFQSIFNLADLAITAGIVMILFSHNQLLSAEEELKEVASTVPPEPDTQIERTMPISEQSGDQGGNTSL